MDYTVIGYGSPEYFKYYNELESSLKNLKIDYKLKKVSSFGKHRDISLYRPTFIFKCIREIKSPVLYVDIDSYFIDKPVFPNDLKFDIGITKRIDRDGIYQPKDRNGAELSNWNFCTIFNYTRNTLHFLRVWKYLCDWKNLHKRVSDHLRLNWTRIMLGGTYNEIFINQYVSGCVIGRIDKGNQEINIGC